MVLTKIDRTKLEKWFLTNHKNADQLNIKACINEALDAFEDRGTYELGRFETITKNPITIDLEDVTL